MLSTYDRLRIAAGYAFPMLWLTVGVYTFHYTPADQILTQALAIILIMIGVDSFVNANYMARMIRNTEMIEKLMKLSLEELEERCQQTLEQK